MSSKKWFFMFLIFSLIIFGGIISFNVIIDPFGVFGDRFLDWYSYDMTQNPRVAKVAYIDREHSKYDSYIIGCSSTSSYPVEMLNKYTKDNFYNMIMYGADIYDSTETAKYLIENYEVKNLFLAVYLSNATKFNYEADKLLGNLHGKIDNTSLVEFYSKYLFLNPYYGIEKIKAKFTDSYLQNKNDVFNVELGMYDKTKRDIEPIGSMEEYVENYPVFLNYPYGRFDELKEIDNCLNSIAELKEICDQKGINFKVMITPLYIDYAKYYDQEDIDLFKTRLAQVTDFWDFSLSSVSTEPRYFYDEAHFRNLVGKMAIARMYNDESIYVPDDFGIYITHENVQEKLVQIKDLAFDDSNYTTEVSILVNDKVEDAKEFEKYVNNLKKDGYSFITFEDMKKYVEEDFSLPKKSLVLVFKENVLDNFDNIYKVLERNRINATIFLEDLTNKDSGKFYSIKEKELINFGLKTGQLSYDDEDEFIEELRGRINDFYDVVGSKGKVFWYENDKYDELTEVIIKEEGFDFSLCGNEGGNTLVKGVDQSLRGLKFY